MSDRTGRESYGFRIKAAAAKNPERKPTSMLDQCASYMECENESIHQAPGNLEFCEFRLALRNGCRFYFLVFRFRFLRDDS